MNDEILIRVQSTPNPNALKFIINRDIKKDGKATFYTADEASGVPLATSLFDVPGVRQVHMFDNVITITHAYEADLEDLKQQVSAVIRTRLPIHDPSFSMEGQGRVSRKVPDTPELQEIDDILNRTIRPGLQADGGDLDVLALHDTAEGRVLEIAYMGACGGCPSSAMGTLDAIESILQAEFDPDLRVVIGG